MSRIVAMIALLLLVGCSQSLYVQGRRLVEQGEYDQAIERFYAEIAKNPQSADAWRELGVAFYEKGDLTKAEDAFKQANKIRPDARTHLYVGLSFEQREMFDEAMRAYGASLSLNPGGETKKLIRAHLDQLIAKSIEKEVSLALENEGAIDVDTIPANTVAVVDFDGSNLSPEMAPLARGLAEFTSIDLAKVGTLRAIDRLKIDVIMGELQLAGAGKVNPAVAPRLGRLLGSYRLVTGSVLGLGDEGFRLDGVIVNAVDSSTIKTDPAEGNLEGIFKLQKDFVFGLIEDMGITLTPSERDAIAEVPTESYLAFLAYCRGLEEEREGNFSRAQSSFSQAIGLDQGFGEAAAKEESMTAQLAVGGEYSLAGFESSVVSTVAPPPAVTELGTRLTTIGANAGGIPDLTTRPPANAPPVVNGVTETVIIRGSFDVD